MNLKESLGYMGIVLGVKRELEMMQVQDSFIYESFKNILKIGLKIRYV